MQTTINANTQASDLDGNYDGQLSAQELAQACNISLQEAQDCISQYDQDGNGMLDAEEFEDLKQQILAQQRNNMTNQMNATQSHADMDADGDGQITALELAAACNITEEEAQNIIYQYDADGDGTLNTAEFLDLKQQILSQQQENMTNAMSHDTYHDNVDADGDGRVSANELAAACNITVQEAQNIIYQYDADGDGTLDTAEFEDLKQQILSQQRNNMTNKIGANDTINTLDGNSDGRLSAKELAAACNISELEAKNIISQYDVNGDGMLNQEEFESLKQQILKQQRQQLADGKQNMDSNNDGLISAEEFAAACNISVDEAKVAIQQFDQNNSGYLDAKEFENAKQKVLKDKERAQQIQQQRQQRQEQQNEQYKDNLGDKVQEFKHKWKLGMNFDPKNENFVIYVSDEVTNKNWGITLQKKDAQGSIRQLYRKLGDAINNGTVVYQYPKNGGPLNVTVTGKQNEKYEYQLPEQQ